MLGVLFVFLLNIVASTMGVLNTILISKKIMKPVYGITFIDAIVFSTVLQLVSNGRTGYYIIAYACGKVCGAFFANKIEDKLAIGILEVSLYAHEEKAVFIADSLREMGYGVTTLKGYGINGSPRFMLDITIQRKELKLLKEILKRFDYDEATMVVRDIKNVSGKIKTSKFN